jgi:hypothetical protein
MPNSDLAHRGKSFAPYPFKPDISLAGLIIFISPFLCLVYRWVRGIPRSEAGTSPDITGMMVSYR